MRNGNTVQAYFSIVQQSYFVTATQLMGADLIEWMGHFNFETRRLLPGTGLN
jgi:hypothetical protein